MQRTIPKRTFQTIAFITLLVPLGVWLVWLIRYAGPLPWLREALAFLGPRESRILAPFVAFLLPFAGWLLVILPLRARSQITTAQEEMERLGATSHWELFRRSLEEQQRERAEMTALPANAPMRVRYFRRLGLIGILVGVLSLLVTGIIVYLSSDVWLTGLVAGIVGVVGGLASLLTGRASIFDKERVERMDRSVKIAVAGIALLVLLLLSLVCVFEGLVG